MAFAVTWGHSDIQAYVVAEDHVVPVDHVCSHDTAAAEIYIDIHVPVVPPKGSCRLRLCNGFLAAHTRIITWKLY